MISKKAENPIAELAWIDEGLPFNAFGASLKRRFGGRIQRVSLDAGFTCPNVDGTVLRGGCNFCDNRSFSPSRRVRLATVLEQLERGITSVRRRYDRVAGFIAYLQPATNTYAPIDQLEELYAAALATSPDVVGLAIGTRPDCVPDSVLDLIDRFAAENYVSLEYGMQSVHDASLRWMNRGHDHASMIDAMARSRGRQFETCAHVILGIPGESHSDMMETADQIGPLGLHAVKLHNLYAVRGTLLGDQVLAGDVRMMERDAYVETVVDFLERIPPEVIVERISGDAPPDYLIEPRWCLEKSGLRLEIERLFQRRGTKQGDRYVDGRVDSAEPVGKGRQDDDPRDRGDRDTQSKDRTPAKILQRIETGRMLPVLKMKPTS